MSMSVHSSKCGICKGPAENPILTKWDCKTNERIKICSYRCLTGKDEPKPIPIKIEKPKDVSKNPGKMKIEDIEELVL